MKLIMVIFVVLFFFFWGEMLVLFTAHLCLSAMDLTKRLLQKSLGAALARIQIPEFTSNNSDSVVLGYLQTSPL